MSPSIWDCAWSVTRTPLDRANHPSAHDDVFGDDVAHNLRCVAEQERATMNVALDLTVDLDLTLGGDIAGDRKALADN